MDVNLVMDLVRDAIFTVFKVAGPAMLIALTVGLVASPFQALTQIQEMTLVFIPKIASIFAALLIFGPFMMDGIMDFTRHIFTHLNDYIQ